VALVFLGVAVAGLGAKPAELSVGGFGFFENRVLGRNLASLLDEGSPQEVFDAGFIEDASLVLNSTLEEQGFFAAKVEAKWTGVDGQTGRAEIDAALSEPLPRPIAARRLRLRAMPGLRAVVTELRFDGLTVLSGEDAEPFFRPSAGLFTPARVRAWSPARAKRGASQLREALRALGFAEAEVEVAETNLDRATGEVSLVVSVREGPRWRVTGWRAGVEGGGEVEGGAPAFLVGEPWTRSLAQDAAQATRNLYHAKGYADVRVSWSAEPGEVGASGERKVVAVAKVEPGEAKSIGAVTIAGAGRTRMPTLERRLRVETGEPYDPQAIDAARRRLARLGVFRRVEAEGLDAGEPAVRDLRFEVVEEPAWQAAWTVGYGSYEQVRGAMEVSRGNLWGLAHRDRAELGQSMKATRGEYRYSVPTFFDDAVEGSARVFGLRREEPSFLRREYGASVEASRMLPLVEARGSAGLSYEVLRAEEVELGVLAGQATRTAVTALNLGLARDRRDNPLRPRAGLRWLIRSETALPELGGEARYERIELAWSGHRGLGEDRWAHVGLSHNLLIDSADQPAPLNKFFLPGGESSIRGYTEGDAAPRDGSGRLVGARSMWLANIEIEQVLTGRWTAVLFVDTLGVSAAAEDWPGKEVLASFGLGLRYQSPVGPLRLEYGRNVNPRPGDPAGTVHFSIGFPF
jgi:outer membrane protein assembly factor BamA